MYHFRNQCRWGKVYQSSIKSGKERDNRQPRFSVAGGKWWGVDAEVTSSGRLLQIDGPATGIAGSVNIRYLWLGRGPNVSSCTVYWSEVRVCWINGEIVYLHTEMVYSITISLLTSKTQCRLRPVCERLLLHVTKSMSHQAWYDKL